MIIWALCLLTFTLTITKCEPPVNSYLPPSSGSGGTPSSQYGKPGENQGQFGGPNSSDQNFGNLLGNSYNPSGLRSPSAEYGTPVEFSPGSQRGGSRRPQGRGQGSVPSSQYGIPNQQGSNGRPGSFPGRGPAQRPDSAYGTPNEFQSPGGFNVGAQGQGPRQPFGGSPSSSYGTPDFGNDLNNIKQNYRESGVDDPNEPAKYEFSYEVDSPETGTKFSHSERRDGDVATGEYNVLLPDGRKQVVEYEADREGFKPQIRYEGIGAGSGSGSGRGGGQGRGQGYQGAGASADTFADSGVGYPGFGAGGRGQGGRVPDFGSSSYPSGGPSQQGFGPGFSGSEGSGGYSGGQGGGYPGSQGRGQSGRGGNSGEGYPSGGPNGPRGSGY